jgi:cytochrome c oxidase cbb3-type subunit III
MSTGPPLAAWMLALVLTAAPSCTQYRAPGQPAAHSEPVPPSQIMNFDSLYAQNCAGCHGPDGQGGLAIGLGNTVYLAIADDATIVRVTSDGVPGTAMPAFAQSSGGTLTGAQIAAIAGGMRSRWARPDALRGTTPPPYAPQGTGDPQHGAASFRTYCSSCHGADGRGGPRAGSIVAGSYLALVSDQALRTTIIAGRPELGSPDWRGDLPGQPMPAEEVSNVVAWLASQRPQFPGQPYSTRLSLATRGGVR